ncbi:conserved hypothetical protein [Ixodes scapularis]|uniref:histone acetyltransferase n=1 Tax=Ixodes scapularis TaxID=6945 RepID=B7Q4L0_IXOSC|nr:conserved hypothetical protein [Ixodes scapularis]|eukprot:XP_002411559.1 conserved hypothetical protein [Ixodes scapularis]
MADHLVDGPPTKRQKLSEAGLSSDSADFSSLWALENELPEELMGSGGGPSLGDLGPPSQNAQQNGTTSVEDTRQHQQLSQLLQSKGVAANHGSPGPKELPKQLGLVVSSSGPLLNGPPQLGAAQAAMGVRASMAGLLAAGGPNSPHQGPQSGMVGPGVKGPGGLMGQANAGFHGGYGQVMGSLGGPPQQRPLVPGLGGSMMGIPPRYPSAAVDSSQLQNHGQQSPLGSSLGQQQQGQPPGPQGAPPGGGPPAPPQQQGPGHPSPGAGVAPPLGAAAPSTADPEKRKLIQQQLVLLLHAHKCQRRESQAANGEVRQCSLPHCRTMKNVLNHMTNCQAGKTCPVPHCASSRQIISHWKNCTRNDCPVCLPLKQASDRRQQQAGAAVQPTQPSQSPAPADMQRAYAALGLPYNAAGGASVNQLVNRGQGVSQMNDLQQVGPGSHCSPQDLLSGPGANPVASQPGAPPGGGAASLGAQAPQRPPLGPSNQSRGPSGRGWGPTWLYALLSVQARKSHPDPVSGVGSVVPPNQVAPTGGGPGGVSLTQPAGIAKDWHQSVTRDLRHHLVLKIVQAIFPTPEPATLQDRRMNKLVAYAKMVEGDMYEMANSREEYYHLLAEKIYKIQKELEEKRRKSKEQQQQQQQQMHVGAPQMGQGGGPSHLPGGASLGGGQRMAPPNITVPGPFPSNSLGAPQGSGPGGFAGGPLQQQQQQSGAVGGLSFGGGAGGGSSNALSSGLDGAIGGLNSQFPQTQQFEAMKRHLIQQQAQQLMNQANQVQLSGNANSGASVQMSQMLQSQLNSTSVGGPGSQHQQQSQQQQQVQSLGGPLGGGPPMLPQASTPQPQQQAPPPQHPPRAQSVPTTLGGSQPPTPLGGGGGATPVSSTGNVLPPPSHQLPEQILATEDSVPEDCKPDQDLSLTLSTPEGSAAPTPAQQGKKSIENLDSSGGPKSMLDSSSSGNGGGGKMEVDCKPDLRSIGKGKGLDMPGENGLPSFGPVKEEPMSVKEEPVATPAGGSGETGATAAAAVKPEVKPDIKTEPAAAEASSASSPPKPRPNKKIFKPDELRQALMPTLEKLYRQDPHSLPFRQPVDPLLLQIPDYFDIVKKPMDLSTIKRKLDTGQYQDPWQYVDDVWLMFDNAWLYNRKTSRVYRYCTKLSEEFEQEIDPVMQSLGYCCGRKFVFQPQVLCCFGKQLCTIPRDAKYWSYQNRYTYCQKCFAEIPGDTVTLGDDPTQAQTTIRKDQFVEMKNDHLELEPFVECLDCGRKLHQVCVLHFDNIWPEGFTCENCLKQKGKKRKENKFTAKPGEVSIRVVACTDKLVEVKPGMKNRYVDTGHWPGQFPYRAKALFAFEEIDGTDTCFFGMHVQEYGSDCHPPNTRRVYIAYLDSVHFFRPKQYRTAVYHEILLGYLDYVKQLGFAMAHIWACPPSEGDDYIFHCHPPEQKIPKPKRLQDWYRMMLDKGIIERIVLEYKDILKQATEDNLTSASELPYFEGDFWPNVLEESIKELDQEEEEKRKAAEALAASAAASEGSQDGEPEGTELGEKKGQKSGRNKKANKSKSNQRKNNKKSSVPHTGNDLSAKIYSTMEKHKEPGAGAKPAGPPVGALQAVQQVQAAAARQQAPHLAPPGGYGKGAPPLQKPLAPAGPRMMPMRWESPPYGQPPQQGLGVGPPIRQQGPPPGQMVPPGAQMGPPNVGGPQRPSQMTPALQQLIQTLKSPASPQQQQQGGPTGPGSDGYPPFAPPLKQSPLSPQQLMQQVRSPPPGQLVRSPQPSPRPIPSPRQQPIPSPHYPSQTHSPHLGGGLVEGPPGGDLMLPQGGLAPPGGPSPGPDLTPQQLAPPQGSDGSELLTPQEQLNKFVENL